MNTAHPPWFQLPNSHGVDFNDNTNDQVPVVVVGCGLAGCNTAFEFATRSIPVVIVDAANTVAAGASSSTAGIVKPFVTRNPSIADTFYKHAFEHLLLQLAADPNLQSQCEFNACGVLQLLKRAYPENPQYTPCTPEQASKIAGTTINSNAIFFPDGGWLNPSALCEALVTHPLIELQLGTKVKSISSEPQGCVITLDSQQNTAPIQQTLQCKFVVLANGYRVNQFDQTKPLSITPARGQCSEFEQSTERTLKTVVSGKRYALPQNKNVIVGASFIRNNTSKTLTAEEHKQNTDAVLDLLPNHQLKPKLNSGFCAVRATTPDRFPVVGPVPDFAFYKTAYARLSDGLPESRYEPARYQPGLYVIGGFGSRGIVSSAYCAKLLVDNICNDVQPHKESVQQGDEHEPSLASWSSLLHPARFAVRNLKRARDLV